MAASRIRAGAVMPGFDEVRTKRKRRLIALRLDLTVQQTTAAALRLSARNPAHWQAEVEVLWGGDESIAFLSVRSAFAAMLEAVAWPEKSEVLVTGINIVDMVRIIDSLGHVAVPIDIDPETLAPDIAEIARRIGPATRALVVAHLFGGSIDLSEVMNVARSRDVMVIEDCAQAYTTRRARDPRESDVRLFSFGLLKTGTALGGALVDVADLGLREKMRNIQTSWRRQSRLSYAAKVSKAFFFLLLQRPVAYGFFSRLCAAAGSSSAVVLRKLTRGFGRGDAAALLRGLRLQPCTPLLAMLAWRLSSENGHRISRRATAGNRMMARLAGLEQADLTRIGYSQARHSHWLVPVSVPDPEGLTRELARAGFDSHGASNIIAIGGPRATSTISGLVFLPCYPEMTDEARDRVCQVVLSHCRGRGEGKVAAGPHSRERG